MVVRLLLWPVALLLEGYHDSDEGSKFCSFFLALGTVFPVWVGTLSQYFFPDSVLWENLLISFCVYLLVGLLANICASSFWGEGFLSFPKNDNQEEEK